VEEWMKTLTKDIGVIAGGWTEGGFGGAYDKLKLASSATPKLYAGLVIAFAVTSIG
jgi:hypothetical protein